MSHPDACELLLISNHLSYYCHHEPSSKRNSDLAEFSCSILLLQHLQWLPLPMKNPHSSTWTPCGSSHSLCPLEVLPLPHHILERSLHMFPAPLPTCILLPRGPAPQLSSRCSKVSPLRLPLACLCFIYTYRSSTPAQLNCMSTWQGA